MKFSQFLFLSATVLLTAVAASCDKIDDGAENGKPVVDPTKGSAPVLHSYDRTSCDYVQLWEGGPKWATFNVGATITDYSDLHIGADSMPFDKNEGLAPYYNTANVGGLYRWNSPWWNGRVEAWPHNEWHDKDIATNQWGGYWKTPTREQLNDLLNGEYTHLTWCDGETTRCAENCPLQGLFIEGLGKYKGNYIFLPAGGSYQYNDIMHRYENGYIMNAGRYCEYWSSTLSYDYVAIIFHASADGNSIFGCDYNLGISVRAILAE